MEDQQGVSVAMTPFRIRLVDVAKEVRIAWILYISVYAATTVLMDVF